MNTMNSKRLETCNGDYRLVSETLVEVFFFVCFFFKVPTVYGTSRRVAELVMAS